VTEAILELADARIEGPSGVLMMRVSASVLGPRVVLAGLAEALAGPLLGHTEITSGTFLVRGTPLHEALPLVGLAPLDPPLTADMTPLEHIVWGARLGGMPAAAAKERARLVCERSGLAEMQKRRLGTLPLVYRRLSVLAQAAVLDPELLIVERPLEGLDDGAARFLLGALGRLSAKCAAVVTVSSVLEGGASGALAEGADEVVTVSAGEVSIVRRTASAPPDATPAAIPSTDDGHG
jgi:ABC-type multidrug transport system ATPase subunit